uniref:Small ribosomal subunit protein uS19c n=1 Tax=Pteridomonas danica TaxID=38822 RepID=A0A7T1FV35_9STRA|nr:ribosomal protein S19 [Pteridomonas danica]QPM99323.1 ribosomal protein S19 [Pteridomonas danica]
MIKNLKKIPFIYYKLLKKYNYNKSIKVKNSIKTWSKGSVILPCMINSTFTIYNGKQHISLVITDEHIGYKLGEFIPTKFFYSHIKKEKKLQLIQNNKNFSKK